MTVLRVTPYVPSTDVARSAAFYEGVLGFDLGFSDLPRIVAATSRATTAPEVFVLTHEISPEAPIPHMLVEVDDIDAVHDRALAGGHPIVYAIRDEPWGARRFFVQDPDGLAVLVIRRPPD